MSHRGTYFEDSAPVQTVVSSWQKTENEMLWQHKETRFARRRTGVGKS